MIYEERKPALSLDLCYSNVIFTVWKSEVSEYISSINFYKLLKCVFYKEIVMVVLTCKITETWKYLMKLIQDYCDQNYCSIKRKYFKGKESTSEMSMFDALEWNIFFIPHWNVFAFTTWFWLKFRNLKPFLNTLTKRAPKSVVIDFVF